MTKQEMIILEVVIGVLLLMWGWVAIYYGGNLLDKLLVMLWHKLRDWWRQQD